jgi:hypothetical protein
MTNAIENLTAAAKNFLRSKQSTNRSDLPQIAALVAGGLLFAVGLMEVMGAFGGSQVLDLADPIFGIPFRHLMVIVGSSQLAVAFVLLFTNRRTLGFGLAAWVALNFLVLRIGFWMSGWHHGTGFAVPQLGFTPTLADFVASTVLIGLLFSIGGVTGGIYLQNRRAAEAAKFHKMFCPSCGGHIKFSVQNLGQKTSCPHCRTSVTLRKDVNLKMSCFFCQGHIEFPAHALDTKMHCPHCNKDITLKEAA